MYRLAWIIAGQGRHAEAEALYVKILARQREILGSDHQSTLRTWYRLARSISAQQGRASEAEEHFRLVLAARRQVLGSDHQATLRARFRVALANVQLRRLDEAIGELRTVIAVQRRILGDDHGDTRDSVRELAGLTPESQLDPQIGAVIEADIPRGHPLRSAEHTDAERVRIQEIG